MQTLIELPEPIKLLLLAFITVAVTQALKWLGAQMQYDLTGYAAQIASALVASVLVLANAGLSKIPAEFAPIVNAIFNLVVVLLTSWGAYKFVGQMKSSKELPFE